MSSHTVTTSTSWFERLGNSFKGIIVGIILFIAGTILLWWNEGNFVRTQKNLNTAQNLTVELENINTVDTSRKGELVHATGTAVTEDMLEDPLFRVAVNAIRLNRDVEYYQWIEDSKSEKKKELGGSEKTTTTYSYHKGWVTNPVDSSRFVKPGASEEHKNTVIADIIKGSWQAENVTFGAYRLPEFLVNSISSSESFPVELSEEVLATLNQQIVPSGLPVVIVDPALPAPARNSLFDEEEEEENGAPTHAPAPSYQWVHVNGSSIYLGASSASPAIGDVRVMFSLTKPKNEVSLIAKLVGDTFERHTNYSALVMGTKSAENMYESAHAANSMLTWILRFVGVIIICLGLGMIVAPLSVLASVIPLVGNIVGFGTGLFSMMFGLAWSLLIIALAWLFYRPLYGILLLAIAVGLIALFFTRKSSSKEVSKASAEK